MSGRPSSRDDRSRWSEAAFERAALRYLGRYESTAAHLRRLLRDRVARARFDGEEVDVDAVAVWIDAVVERAVAEGWVDDERYARRRLETLRRRGESRRGVRRKLEGKGVPRALIDALLAEEEQADAADADVEVEAARRLVRRRRLGPARTRAPRPGDESRDLAALARAGFSFDVARRVLGEDRR